MEFQLSYSKSWKMMLWRAALNMPANLENSAVATGLEKISFHSNPQKGNVKKHSNIRTTALISHVNKVILKILQATLQQYVNRKLPDIQPGFRKGSEEQVIKLPTSVRLSKKPESSRKPSTSALLTIPKPLTVWITNNLWKIMKDMGPALEKTICRSASKS